MSLSKIEEAMQSVPGTWKPGTNWTTTEHEPGTTAYKNCHNTLRGELHIWAYTDMPGLFGVTFFPEKEEGGKARRIAYGIGALEVLCIIEEYSHAKSNSGEAL